MLDNRRKPAGALHTIITARDGKEYELLNRVSEEERLEIIQALPYIDFTSFKPDSKNPSQPYRIVFGEGTFMKVSLARTKNAEGEWEYLAMKKIMQVEQMKKANMDREELLATTRTEMKLHHVINDLQKSAHQYFSVASNLAEVSKTKKEVVEAYGQIYQFMPIADFGTTANLRKLISQASLNTKDAQQLREYYAFALIDQVRFLNENHFYVIDIKPENLLLTSNGNLLISDFGSSIYFGAEEKLAASSLADSNYAPPADFFEINNEEQSKRVRDRWALGLTLLKISDESGQLSYIADQFFNLARNYYYETKDKTTYKHEYEKLIVELSELLNELEINVDLKNFIRSSFQFEPIPQKQMTLTPELAKAYPNILSKMRDGRLKENEKYHVYDESQDNAEESIEDTYKETDSNKEVFDPVISMLKSIVLTDGQEENTRSKSFKDMMSYLRNLTPGIEGKKVIADLSSRLPKNVGLTLYAEGFSNYELRVFNIVRDFAGNINDKNALKKLTLMYESMREETKNRFTH